MNVTLNRLRLTDRSSIGRLYLDGTYQCYTLEDKTREIASQPVETWKIPHQTAIPCGTYPIAFSWSPKFGREMPLLLGVPGYTDVRIHWGNTEIDTDGCILVGQTRVGNDFVGDSRSAFSLLFLALRSAASQGPLILTVSVDPQASDTRTVPTGNVPSPLPSKS